VSSTALAVSTLLYRDVLSAAAVGDREQIAFPRMNELPGLETASSAPSWLPPVELADQNAAPFSPKPVDFSNAEFLAVSESDGNVSFVLPAALRAESKRGGRLKPTSSLSAMALELERKGDLKQQPSAFDSKQPVHLSLRKLGAAMKTTRACPNPLCECIAVKSFFYALRDADVRCRCGVSFCVLCGLAPHRPVSCVVARRWWAAVRPEHNSAVRSALRVLSSCIVF
jgi:hypothetical protein